MMISMVRTESPIWIANWIFLIGGEKNPQLNMRAITGSSTLSYLATYAANSYYLISVAGYGSSVVKREGRIEPLHPLSSGYNLK